MRFNVLACIAFLVPAFLISEGIYDYTVPSIEGGDKALSDYQGKRILIVTLPVSQTAAADSFLYSLDSLATSRASTLSIIGVPAIEDGYTAAQKTVLTSWYRSKLDSSILITEGLYTRKTSGTNQHPLFKWLTDVNMNEVFDMDVAGSGYKFFVRETGELYGVLGAGIKLSSNAINKTLNLQ